MRRSVDVAERETLDQQHRRELEHLSSARDSKIEKIRRRKVRRVGVLVGLSSSQSL